MRTRSATLTPSAFERGDLCRVVGHQPDRMDAEQLEHARRNRKVAGLGRQAEPVVGIDRVEALVLQR
jgi:hypothetical protein